MSAAVFAGTHMYVMYGVGAFNEVSIVAMLKPGWMADPMAQRQRLVLVSYLPEF